MDFDSRAVEAAQRMVREGKWERLRAETIQRLMLGSVMEIVCCGWNWRADGDTEALSLFSEWARQHSIIKEAGTALNHRGLRPVEGSAIWHSKNMQSGSSQHEFFPAPLVTQWKDDQWTLYQDRFRRAMVDNGFGKKIATGLSMAMAEMADNVIQHSGTDKQSQANAVVGYHVMDGSMTYAVADVGRGILKSLRQKEHWQKLQNSEDALVAVIRDGATRRENESRGEGFRHVLNALTDLNGHLRFRSGNGCLAVDGRGDARKFIVKKVPELIGFQLTVTCSRTDQHPPMYIDG